MRVRPRNPVKCTDLGRDGNYIVMILIRNSLDMQGVISRTTSTYFINIILIYLKTNHNHDDSGHDCMLVGPTSLQEHQAPSTTTWCCLQGRRIQLKFSPAQPINGSLDLESGLMDLLKIMITSSLTMDGITYYLPANSPTIIVAPRWG